MSDTTRRAVLAGAAGIAAVSVMTACGDGSGKSNGAGSGGNSAGGNGGNGGNGGKSGGNSSLPKTTDVPVGGGVVVAAADVVITQPSAGQFKAFSATCTHQGCTVADVSGGTINCGCHFSKFSATDGSVKNGPATQPLPQKKITVSGTTISVG
jgi:Rieske Fe-S protein